MSEKSTCGCVKDRIFIEDEIKENIFGEIEETKEKDKKELVRYKFFYAILDQHIIFFKINLMLLQHKAYIFVLLVGSQRSWHTFGKRLAKIIETKNI